MAVKFLTKIRESLGLTRYGLARRLNIPTQSVDYFEKDGQSLKLSVLVKLRKIGGLTWIQLGKMLDDEFDDSKPINK